jgi:hypothetical protein
LKSHEVKRVAAAKPKDENPCVRVLVIFLLFDDMTPFKKETPSAPIKNIYPNGSEIKKGADGPLLKDCLPAFIQ